MTETVKTACGRMDHGGCTLLVEVEEGKITGVKPDPEGPLSRGHICPKAKAIPGLLNHPRRLRQPLLRRGERGAGDWEEISWDRALDLAAGGLDRVRQEYGARSVGFCQGAPKGLEHFVLIRLANTFGSPNVVGPQNVCHMPREIPSMLTCGFFPVADYDSPTKAVLVWGSNLPATNEEGVICSRLYRRIREDHPALIVVDPRRTDLAQRADLWLPIKPGTDGALALAFLQVIISREQYDRDFVASWTHGFSELAGHVRDFTPQWAAEITGIEPGTIVRAAEMYASADPALIQWGNGIEQNHNNFNTARSLLSLMAVCGNLDAPGGNIAASPPPVARLGEFVRGDLLPTRSRDMISAPFRPAPGFMIVPPEYFKKAVLTGDPYPVRGAYVQVSNPVLAWSNSLETHRALKSLDFLVVTETFMSPTAALADLVLPAATEFEYNDLGHFGLAHGFLLARPHIVDPPPQCWPNIKIMNELAKKLGPADIWWEDVQDMLEAVLAPSGLSYDQLAVQGILRGPVKYHKYRAKGFKTPTGKVELLLSRAQKAGLDPLPVHVEPSAPLDDAFPYILSSHKSRYFFCSDHRYLEELRDREPEPMVELHPDTAATAGVSDGAPVLVETRHGRIKVKARITEKIRPGTLSVVHGWWRPELGAENEASWNETTLNLLTSGQNLNKALGTPEMRGLAARIGPLD